MPPDFHITALLQALVFPPGPSIVLLALAILFRASQRLCTAFLIAGAGSLYLSSIPATALWLRQQLETFPPVSLAHGAAEAIVVLGADRYKDAPEYGGDTVRGFGLERLRYAAWLQKKTGLPILVSGGAVLNEPIAEAELMRDILSREFCAQVRWVEGKSRNTYENALFSSQLLKGAGIGEVLLVTHAWHMRRALEAFENAGMKATPAPTQFTRAMTYETGELDWLPSAAALQKTQLTLHEIVGRWWYHFHYYRAEAP